MNKPLSTGDIEAARERVIVVAARLFSEEGADAVTMRRLAAELGVSRQTPYNWFRDKADILDHIRVRALERLTARYEQAIAENPDALSRMAAFARHYVDFALSDPHTYHVLFDLRTGISEHSPAVAAAVARLSETGRGPLRECVEAGLLRGPVEEVDLSCWAALHGLVSLHLSGRLPPGWTAGRLFPFLMEVVGAGLKP